MLSGKGNENSQKISTGRSDYRASDRSWEKKVKFRGIFRNKIAEKLANFAGNFGANLSGKQLVKKRRILWLFSG